MVIHGLMVVKLWILDLFQIYVYDSTNEMTQTPLLYFFQTDIGNIETGLTVLNHTPAP